VWLTIRFGVSIAKLKYSRLLKRHFNAALEQKSIEINGCDAVKVANQRYGLGQRTFVEW